MSECTFAKSIDFGWLVGVSFLWKMIHIRCRRFGSTSMCIINHEWIVFPVCAGETSGRIHGISKTSTWYATKNHRVFRASISRQILRWGLYTGRTKRKASRRCYQLQLSVCHGIHRSDQSSISFNSWSIIISRCFSFFLRNCLQVISSFCAFFCQCRFQFCFWCCNKAQVRGVSTRRHYYKRRHNWYKNVFHSRGCCRYCDGEWRGTNHRTQFFCCLPCSTLELIWPHCVFRWQPHCRMGLISGKFACWPMHGAWPVCVRKLIAIYFR